MKRPSKSSAFRPLARRERARVRAAFTLVEMLVVITIIGILAALGTGAVMHAIHVAKVAAVGVEISQLDTALKAYKAKFGEYPPDFTDLSPTGPVAQHLAKAFPRYNTANWPTDIAARFPGVPLTPQTALAIWLGGIPDPANGGHLSGFAADPTNPFQTVATCPSRTPTFFEFDLTRLYAYRYWPKNAIGNRTVSSTTPGAIVYFRAENGTYVMPDGVTPKWVTDAGDSSATVYAAVDTRVGNTWLNQSSMQIFCSGLDLKYGTPTSSPLLYPAGTNYNDTTGYIYDNITNFSDGKTLEDKIP